MIFIIKGFRAIVFIFIAISTTFRPICPPAFFRWLSNSGNYSELRTTSFIESTESPVLIPLAVTSVKYACIVTRLLSRLNQQPPDDCLLRSLGNQQPTVTLCVLELIFGTYKLYVLTRLGLCMIFYPCSYSDFFYLTFYYSFPYCIHLYT